MSQQPQSIGQVEHARHQALLKRLDRFASVMDSHFQVPGTRLRFGLDGLIGLVPVAGDTVTTLLGLYILLEAMRIGAPRAVVRRIAVNIGLDFLIGLVPVAGDALDFAFKANQRNTELLRDYTQAQLEPPRPESNKTPLVWVMAAMGAVLLVLVILAL